MDPGPPRPTLQGKPLRWRSSAAQGAVGRERGITDIVQRCVVFGASLVRLVQVQCGTVWSLSGPAGQRHDPPSPALRWYCPGPATPPPARCITVSPYRLHQHPPKPTPAQPPVALLRASLLLKTCLTPTKLALWPPCQGNPLAAGRVHRVLYPTAVDPADASQPPWLKPPGLF